MDLEGLNSGPHACIRQAHYWVSTPSQQWQPLLWYHGTEWWRPMLTMCIPSVLSENQQRYQAQYSVFPTPYQNSFPLSVFMVKFRSGNIKCHHSITTVCISITEVQPLTAPKQKTTQLEALVLDVSRDLSLAIYWMAMATAWVVDRGKSIMLMATGRISVPSYQHPAPPLRDFSSSAFSFLLILRGTWLVSDSTESHVWYKKAMWDCFHFRISERLCSAHDRKWPSCHSATAAVTKKNRVGRGHKGFVLTESTKRTRNINHTVTPPQWRR